MNSSRKIKTALISVFHKDRLELIIKELHALNIQLYATGGTQSFIEQLNIPVIPVEELTTYPSILGGRVKTLHPKVFGGILSRRENLEDNAELTKYQIPEMDLVIVDLYPFEETLASGASEAEIIEKIDIGGISLIRAAAKNFNDVLIIPSRNNYDFLLQLLNNQKGISTLEDRKKMAMHAFNVSSQYDLAIFNYFNRHSSILPFSHSPIHSESETGRNGEWESVRHLRYGENPHQQGVFHGDMELMFEQLNGKELSYNNLLDIDAAISLMNDFKESSFAILKHNNACGIASRDKLIDAWKAALEADTISAFGGVLIANREIDMQTAEEMNKLFFEVLIAPAYEEKVIVLLKQKKNRIILLQKQFPMAKKQSKTLLNGIIEQDRDLKTESTADMKVVTIKSPTNENLLDLEFANKVVKHSKSNAIVLAKNKQLLASGVGQTSRVDALKQAIVKAIQFGFDLQGAVMASDAFFPFADCVEIAHQAGIISVIQPGGSVKDSDSIEFCNQHNMSMVFTGTRHFKH